MKNRARELVSGWSEYIQEPIPAPRATVTPNPAPEPRQAAPKVTKQKISAADIPPPADIVAEPFPEEVFSAEDALLQAPRSEPTDIPPSADIPPDIDLEEAEPVIGAATSQIPAAKSLASYLD